MNEEHEQRLAEAFVALADTLVDEFDVLDFLSMLAERAAGLLSVSAAGVVLSDQRGGLATTAASSEQARVLEIVAAQTDDGPCRDCLHTGSVVTSADLSMEADRWPRFVPAAQRYGYRAASAVPMRLRGQIVGALTLLNNEPEGVDDASTRLGQALADVATISILQQRAIDRTEILSEQLQATLNNNVILAQARGVLAEHGNLSMPRAHALLREHARQPAPPAPLRTRPRHRRRRDRPACSARPRPCGCCPDHGRLGAGQRVSPPHRVRRATVAGAEEGTSQRS